MTKTSAVIRMIAGLATAAALTAGACSDSTAPSSGPPPPPDTSITTYSYTIVNTFPHDNGAYTQGLVFVDSVFIEGTGYYLGPSTLRRVDVETGDVLFSREMPPPTGGGAFFGEGVAVWGDTIVQLSWQKHEAVVYELETFDEIGRFGYPTEGWGLTHDGTRFIMSDGSATLYFRDKDTFAETGRVTVFDDHGTVAGLNELEYIAGLVFANVYTTRWIVMIDPGTGRVRGRVQLNVSDHTTSHVANGIAYDPVGDRLFVTGKLWSHLYEIDLIEGSSE